MNQPNYPDRVMMRVWRLLPCILVAGCATPVPYVEPSSPGTATILAQDDGGFLFCHYAWARLVDGKRTYDFWSRFPRSVPVEAGHRTLSVMGESGSDLMLGSCWSICFADITFEARPGGVYQLFLAKDLEPQRITLTDTATNQVIADEICR
jgi:hypothetical protein